MNNAEHEHGDKGELAAWLEGEPVGDSTVEADTVAFGHQEPEPPKPDRLEAEPLEAEHLEPVPLAPRLRRQAKFGTIFWGVILLSVAITVGFVTLAPTDTVTLTTVIAVSAGIILVISGIAVSIGGRRRS